MEGKIGRLNRVLVTFGEFKKAWEEFAEKAERLVGDEPIDYQNSFSLMPWRSKFTVAVPRLVDVVRRKGGDPKVLLVKVEKKEGRKEDEARKS